MKKAFTLVEVIISVVLILVIGTSAFFIFVNNSSNKIESFEEEILNAANLYISVETDDDGKNFLNGINSGGKGVILPLTKLVEKGYLSDKVVETIKEEKGDSAIEDNHVLALLGDGSLNNDCSGVTLTISWDESYTKEVYLCPTSNSSGGTDMPNVGEPVKFTFILDPKCTKSPEGSISHTNVEVWEFIYGEGDKFYFPYSDGYCWNAKGYQWKSLFNNIEYESSYFSTDFWNDWDPRDTVFTMVNLKLPTLEASLNENGYEKNKYIPGDSQNNFVSYGGELFRIFYYGDEGIKLLLDGDIGISKFNNGDGSNYKDFAFHYYDSEIKLETKNYPDLGLSNVKILTQEQKGSKESSTIKYFLKWWYYSIDETTITKPIKMYYCTQKNGNKNFTSNLDNCLDKNEVGASIATDVGLLTRGDLSGIGYGFNLQDGYINVWEGWDKPGLSKDYFYKYYPDYDKPYWLMNIDDKIPYYIPADIELNIDGPDYWDYEDSLTASSVYPNINFAVRPVIMLNSDVEFIRGTGTRDDPYFVL